MYIMSDKIILYVVKRRSIFYNTRPFTSYIIETLIMY